MNRRSVVKRLAAAAGISTALGAGLPSKAAAAERYRWKMCTAWSPQLPILQEGAELFAKMVESASGGRLRIKVFAGGELIPPLEVFDAVSSGSIELGSAAPYYWAGKVPAAQFFGAIPFGFTAQQQNAWLIGAGGLELWRKLYAPFNLVPFALGNTGAQMAGWFKREVGSVADLQGMKIRLPGLGGKVLAALGANVVLMAGGEIYTSLERGVIDAAEWVNPFQDERMGLQRAAKLYYYPGWQEPNATLELMVNSAAWQKLPADLKEIVSAAAGYLTIWTLSRCEAENGPALARLRETHGVRIEPLPAEVLKKLREASKDVIAELARTDPLAAEIHRSYESFAKTVRPWSAVADEAVAQSLRS